MAGVLLNLVPKRFLNFDNLQVGVLKGFALVEHIDISQYSDAALVVRVHSAIVAADGSISFSLYGDGFTEEEPGVLFPTPSALFGLALISGFSSSGLLLTIGGTVRGHYAALVCGAQRGSLSSLNATVSIDLVLRCPSTKNELQLRP